jgi:hypothetical protein
LLDCSIWIAIQLSGLDCQSSFFCFNLNPKNIQFLLSELKFNCALCFNQKSPAYLINNFHKNVWQLRCELIKRSPLGIIRFTFKNFFKYLKYSIFSLISRPQAQAVQIRTIKFCLQNTYFLDPSPVKAYVICLCNYFI